MKTHYELLGISRHASPAQIKDAYQNELEALVSAQQFATNNELKIRRMVLQQAYQTLSSPARRQQYDASPTGRHNGGKLIARRPPLQTVALSILSVAVLGLGAYAIGQHGAGAKPAPPDNSPQPARFPVPDRGSAHRASSQVWRKSENHRNRLVEEMRAQQGQQEQLHGLAAQTMDGKSGSESN